MHVIGLTGGIGTGKSTVAQLLDELGATVLSADLIGHEVYLPGRPAFHELVNAFGNKIVGSDGTIDRKRLGEIVFGNPRELTRLNNIVHPRMKGMMRERLQELAKKGTDIAVIEAAILFEAKWDDLTDEIWVTIAEPEIAAHRVAERNRMPLEKVLERIRSQMSNKERIRRAQVVIDTSGDMESTLTRTRECWEELQTRLAKSA
jgi:dephospho-CoA kinase